VPLPDKRSDQAPDVVCEMSNVPVPVDPLPRETEIERRSNSASVARSRSSLARIGVHPARVCTARHFEAADVAQSARTTENTSSPVR